MNIRETVRSRVQDFTGVTKLSEQLQTERLENENLREAMSELQLALEDRGWQKVASDYDTEFTPDNIRLITKIARVFRIKNPLVKCAVELQANYIFGKGVTIASEEESVQKEIEAFLEDNKAELGNQGLWNKECTLRTDGNLYFVLFDDNSSGKVKVRTLDALEVQEKYCNPEDASEVWYFKRCWSKTVYDLATGTPSSESATAWYPALGLPPEKIVDKIGPDPVQKNSPVIHVKVGGLEKWKFGLSEVYAALDWAKAFTMFLTSWATIQESLRRIAIQVITPGGTKAQQRVKSAVNTTLADGSGQEETSPPPVTGAWWISGPGQKLQPLMTRNATTAPDEARQIKLQVCAALGLPEHFFGDPSTSNLATSKTLDRPTELKFIVRQELWRELLQVIVTYAMLRSKQSANGKLKEAKVTDAQLKVRVTFPPVLEHDIKQWVDAVVSAATLNGSPMAGTIDARTLATMLLEQIPGVENVKEIVDAMYPPDSYDPEEWAAQTAEEKQANALAQADARGNVFGDQSKMKQREALQILGRIIETAVGRIAA